jgi:pimeloyl-ACP methyl ester carboxylesterase
VTPSAVRAGTVERSGLPLAYTEQGAGDPLVFIHGTAVGSGLWREVRAELGDGTRTIAYDRRAYGESEPPEPYTGTTVAEQGEDAAALIERLEAAPAVVCGHDLGALVALDLLRRHGGLVRGAVLIEPPLLALSASGPAVVSALREAIEAGARAADEPGAGAVEAYLRETAGEEGLELLGPDRLEAARSAGRALAADFAAAPTFAFERRELRSLTAPIAVVTGARSDPVRREVALSLAGLLPSATLLEPDAGHLVPVEAPEAIARALGEVAAR